ncbi:MAG TPA: hypothetical protein VFL94_11905 [Actinomycetales bacterium]|nr:hypothetical protein [Actinomycetales bacterium]
MEPARHLRVGVDRGRPGWDRLRRSGVLVVAAFAALATLLVPSPAVARPANALVGSVASTGGVTGAIAVGHTGRRAQRGDQGGTSALAAPAASRPGASHPAARAGSSRAVLQATGNDGAVAEVLGSHVAGHGPVTGSLPTSTTLPAPGAVVVLTCASRDLRAAAGSGATDSRAPPTA